MTFAEWARVIAVKPGNAVLLLADTVFWVGPWISFRQEVFWNLNDHLLIDLRLRGA